MTMEQLKLEAHRLIEEGDDHDEIAVWLIEEHHVEPMIAWGIIEGYFGGSHGHL